MKAVILPQNVFCWLGGAYCAHSDPRLD